MSIRTKVFFPAQQSSHNHHSNEIRRWKVESFEDLQERAQQVLDIPQHYRFEYLDDVNDWIVLEHPDEWDEAVASSSQNVLVVRVIPRVVQQKRSPHHQRPPTRRGHPAHCAPRACPRLQQQPHCSALSSGLAGALQALPFIIQLAAPAQAQGKRTVPIHSTDVPINIEIRRTKPVSVPVEAPKEGAVEIPITRSAPRVIRRIPIEDAADEIQVKKCSNIQVEVPAQDAVEIPVTVSPVRHMRSIPIEEAPVEQPAEEKTEAPVSAPQTTEEEAPLVEKEESKPLEVEMSGVIENDYTIENDEDASEIIVDEDKEEEEEPQQQQPASPQAPSQEWQNEEDLLQSMGFQDSKLNFHLLRHHKGNMERTINSLLQLEQ